MKMRKRAVLDEPLMCERGSPGRIGYSLPEDDTPNRDLLRDLPDDLCRATLEHFPEVSELEVVRHFTRLSQWNFSAATTFYPLGSCTMKYNPKFTEKIAAMAGEHRVHFVNPAAKRINKSLGDAAGLKNLGIHMMTVAPGDRSSEYHCHRYEDEAIYVISGRGTAVIGDERYALGPGDFMGHPIDRVAHEMINDGNEPLVCLVIGQRLAQDISDYPRKGKRLYRHSGERSLVDLDGIKRV